MAILTAVGASAIAGPVTNFIVSQNISVLTTFSLFADHYTYIVLPLSLLVFYSKLGWRRIAALFVCMLLLYISVTYMKGFFQQPRLCNEYLKMGCPADYSFPSGHAAVAFAFAFFSIGTVAFPFYYVSAFLIALSRVYLGVHVLNDIAGGVVVGIFCYFVSEKVVKACLSYEEG
jgi:membrane-associated phospholipid phosphatase